MVWATVATGRDVAEEGVRGVPRRRGLDPVGAAVAERNTGWEAAVSGPAWGGRHCKGRHEMTVTGDV